MRRFFGFLGLLCLIFFQLAAQERINNISAAGVQVGQRVPDVLVTGVTGMARPSFRFSELRGKMVLLDFWASWCAPCRAMVPRLDSLQKEFGSRLLVLPVGYESAQVLAPVLAQLQQVHPFSLPLVAGDQALHTMFPHRSLPHYVWVDSAGVVLAITEEKEVTARNVRRALTSGKMDLTQKTDLKQAYNNKLPLLLNGNGGDGSSLLYHSVLTGYIPGIGSGTRVSAFDPEKGQLFTLRNVPFLTLCGLAYSDGGRYIMSSAFKVLSRDSLRMTSRLTGQAYLDWQAAGNGWCYELSLPPRLVPSAFAMIRQDIARLFPQYTVSLERQQARCLALVRTSSADKIQSAGGTPLINVGPYAAKLQNATLYALMQRLKMQYLQGSKLPLVDLSGYTGRVDLSLEAKMYDAASINAALAKYDLALVERDAPVEMVVIRDTNAKP